MDGLLSKRENEVMQFLLKGRKNKEIAQEMGISANTVETHLQHIYAKLNVTSRTEALLIYLTKKKNNGNP